MKQSLATLTSKIGSGATPRGGASVYQNDGIALIRSQNVHDWTMKRDGLAHITDSAANLLAGVTVHKGDVLINITGDSIARCCVVDPCFLPARVNQHVAIIRPSPGLVPGFLAAVLINPEMKSRLLSDSAGGTRNALTKKYLEHLQIDIPSVSTQRAIAEVLGALDDKIAANTALAHTADELAHTIFQSLPKRTDIDSVTYGDVATVNGGGTPSTKTPEYWGGDIPWATPTDITALPGPYIDRTSREITREGLDACASGLYPEGSILMTSRATIGAFAIASRAMAVNQGFIVVRPINPNDKWWLFHEMRSRVAEYLNMANGATFLELSRGKFKALTVSMNDQVTIEHFADRVAPLHSVARGAFDENRTLAELRDTLLPELMSGKLRVKDAERQVEAVV